MNLKNVTRLAGLVLMGLSVLLAWPPAEVVRAEPQIDADAGKQVWAAKLCKNCHGANAEGNYAPPLAGLARNAKTLDDVIKQVRTPARVMPAWSTDQVSDADLANLVDYLKTLPPNPDWKFTPYQAAPGEDPGKTLFNQKDCAACHGQNAEKIIAQSVKGTGRTTITAADIMKQVRTPRKSMPTFKDTVVTDADIATMAPWIKAQVDQQLAAPASASSTPAATTPAPSTLPKTGDDSPQMPWALVAGLAGLVCLGTSVWLHRRAPR